MYCIKSLLHVITDTLIGDANGKITRVKAVYVRIEHALVGQGIDSVCYCYIIKGFT